MAHLCSTMSGASPEKTQRFGVSGQLQAVRVSSLPCPVVDVEPFHVG